jgi:predicted MFS family arabinose efflux permease
MSTHIVLLGAAGFIAVGSYRISDPLLPAIADDFSTSVGAVALTVTAFTLGYAIFQLVHGPLGDRIGKLRVISAMLALTSLTTIACAFADTVSSLATLRFAAGMTAGAVAPLSMAHIGDTVPYESRMAMIGRFLMAALFGQMVAGSLAGVFAELWGWRPAFAVFGATGLIVAICLAPSSFRAARPAGAAATLQGTTHVVLLRIPLARIIWAAAFLEGCITMGAVPYVGAYLRQHYAMDYATIGFVLASFGVGGIIYSFNVKPILRTLGERRMVIMSGILVSSSYFSLSAAPPWQLFMPLLAMAGLGFFCMHGVLQVHATEIAPQARGTALAGFVFYLFLGQGAGVFVMSYLVDGPGYRAAFAIAASAVILLTAWLYRYLFAAVPA